MHAYRADVSVKIILYFLVPNVWVLPILIPFDIYYGTYF